MNALVLQRFNDYREVIGVPCSHWDGETRRVIHDGESLEEITERLGPGTFEVYELPEPTVVQR